ncbi:MAG: lipase family protein [Taibaiella sp.]|nr:lipase family protein [Taibaiella sp.]
MRFLYFKIAMGLAAGLVTLSSWAQGLQPGFQKEEYRELMYISARTSGGPDYYNQFPEPQYKMIYRSEPIGLDNLWDLWLSEDKIAVISIRGTTQNAESWLANLYAAMVPAKGVLKLSSTDSFSYHFADNPRAAVHVGWLLSTAYLAKEIIPKINELYRQGVRDVLITGHSQGGAISFLVTSHLYGLQQNGGLPKDIRFKTYCSAAPKPGNLYYAYDYEAKTQGGWAYNVVNAADWVPEVPMSIQTVADFNNVNPFNNADAMIKKQKLLQRLALRHIYRKLSKPTQQAQKNYEKYLGKMTSKMIRKNLPEFLPPDYYNSNHYVRTGRTIVLLPDEAYYKMYPDDKDKTFMHHFHKPYLVLLEQLGDEVR